MNLGVETVLNQASLPVGLPVSAFSDESWGGDRAWHKMIGLVVDVSAFSDESWGGDLKVLRKAEDGEMFQHSLMNLGVETPQRPRRPIDDSAVSAFSDESWGGDQYIK